MASGGVHVEVRPRERWHTLLRDAHPGYITWADHEENLRRLRANAQTFGAERGRARRARGRRSCRGWRSAGCAASG